MIIEATYENEPCFVNGNYIIDIFITKDGDYIAYTMDFDRGGYIIRREEFEKFMRGEE